MSDDWPIYAAMNNDWVIYTVIWMTGRAQSHILDFDDEASAIKAMCQIEGQAGNHSVSMSTQLLDENPCPPEVKARVDAVINGRMGLECGKLRLRIAELEAAR